MFTHLAIHYPRPEYRDELRASMRRVDAAARACPGIVRVDAWDEAGGDRLIGIALWESREAFEASHDRVFAVVADDPFDLWCASPTDVMHLDIEGDGD